MMRFLKSIRVKLTLWYSFILLTTLLGFGLVAYTYSNDRLSENLDRSLRNEVRWVKSFIAARAAMVKPSKKFGPRRKAAPSSRRSRQLQPDTVPSPPAVEMTQSDEELTEADEEIWNQIYEHALLNPKKTMIEVTDKSRMPIFRSFSVGEESLMIGPVPLDSIRIITVKDERGVDLRVAATSTTANDIYVAYPLGELGEVLENLFSIFLILVPIALAVSIGGGWFLAYTSLRPVDEITRTAREISARNLDRQIPQRGVDDEIGRLISTFNDMLARLRQSFDQIRQFSIDASHELRTPLTIMRGEAELALRNPKSPDEYRRVLVSNLEEILRLASIIDSLLELSTADPGRQELSFEKVNLREMLAELLEDSEVIAEKKHICVRLEHNEEAVILGDAVRLRQLFLNLIDNAIKYTPERGHLSLSSTAHRDGFVRIEVRDDGIGIPKEDLQKIFLRFYRVEKGRSREMGGSGLGLSIARSIARLHRGRIEVESELGKGTTFTVWLPLAPPPPAG